MNKLLKCPAGIIKFTFFALYLFVLYELLVIPAILDWSVYGIVLSLVIAGLLVRSLPADHRRNLTVLGLAFLLSIKALGNITELPWFRQAGGTLVIFILLFVICRLLGKVSLRRFLTVFLVALAINSTVNLAEVPLWTEFSVKWRSPVLYREKGTVDYFPLQAADVNNDGKAEVITQGNLEAVRKEREEIIDEKEENRFLQREDNEYLVFAWNGKTFTRLGRQDYSMDRLVNSLQPDYINFPYYGIEWAVSPRGMEQKLAPLIAREELVEKTMRFGEAPFVALALNLRNLELRLAGPAPLNFPSISMEKPFKLKASIMDSKLAGTYAGSDFSVPTDATAILGAGRMLSGASAQIAVLGEKLQVFDIQPDGKTKLLNEITPAEIPDIGTAEALLADVNSDGTDELLLNTERAKILKLGKDGRWQVLWASRDESFRFEGFAPLGKDGKPQIIALAKSNVRKNLTRYMTGYEFTTAGLEQRWRVFSGLINLQAADVDGDKQNELAGYLYKKHLVLVLEKHRLPVVPALYGLTAGLIIYGFVCQTRQGRNIKGGGPHA
ncbi:MAG: hypothetical protein ACOY4Q_08800 [Bacillota bacterium]